MEEFQESEVLWPEHHHHHRRNNANKSTYNQMSSPQPQSQSQSQPVSIPNASNLRSSLRWSEFENLKEEEEDDDGGEKMVPPHEILGRRWNGKMAFSVCTGNGRTLKGRDLSKVRNSILRMTGFLESC